MSITSVNPYLQLDGTAEQAIKLYESALGAKTEDLMRFGQMPGDHAASEHKDRIIHAALRIGPSALMISDTMPGTSVTGKGNVQVIVHFDDPAEMGRAFDALAAGGEVGMPLSDTFWNARFGTLTDRFGVRWMFNCPLKKE